MNETDYFGDFGTETSAPVGTGALAPEARTEPQPSGPETQQSNSESSPVAEIDPAVNQDIRKEASPTQEDIDDIGDVTSLDETSMDEASMDEASMDGLPSALPAEVYAGWVELVGRIKSGEPGSMEELYRLFSKGIRFYLCRQLGHQELDDKVHDTFVVVVQAIRRGELREPERLMGFVRTIVRRQVAAHIDKVVHNRREQVELDSTVKVVDTRENPEEGAIFRQRAELIQRVLTEMPERDREILTRFYLHEQSQDKICEDMSLTETQFRLLKSRAKARFGELGKKKLAQRSLHSIYLRTSAGSLH